MVARRFCRIVTCQFTRDEKAEDRERMASGAPSFDIPFSGFWQLPDSTKKILLASLASCEKRAVRLGIEKRKMENNPTPETRNSMPD
jgi:hypothetical protein